MNISYLISYLLIVIVISIGPLPISLGAESANKDNNDLAAALQADEIDSKTTAPATQEQQSPAATKDLRTSTIDALIEKLAKTKDPTAQKALHLKIAAMHRANKNYLAAMDEYRALYALAQSDAERARYVIFAIETQSMITQWPIRPPWRGPSPDAARNRREDLYALYQKLLPMSPPTLKWRVLAQMGLLLISFDQPSAAFELWQQNLGDALQNRNKQYAAGMMLEYYQAHPQTQAESIALLVENMHKSGIKPIFTKSQVNAEKLYADAVILSAQKYSAQQKHEIAIDILKKFVASSDKNPRLEEALFALGEEYYAMDNLPMAIQTTESYLETFPAGEHAKPLLIKGITRAKITKNDTMGTTLCLLYLKEFPKGLAAVMARETLADIYFRKGWYGDASKLYKAQAQAPDLVINKRVKSALIYMQLEERYGDKINAHWGAQFIIQYGKNDPEALTSATVFEANYLVANKDFEQLAQLESVLAHIDNGQTAVRRAHGYVKNMMAKNKTGEHFGTIASASNNRTTIDSLYTTFVKKAEALTAKCKNNAAVCQRTNKELQNLAKATIGAISKVTLADNSESSHVALISHRNRLINKIKKQIAAVAAQP